MLQPSVFPIAIIIAIAIAVHLQLHPGTVEARFGLRPLSRRVVVVVVLRRLLRAGHGA